MLKLALSFLALAVVLALATPDIAARLSAITQPKQEGLPPGSEEAVARVMVAADSRGHFATDLTINGRPMTALVDTGASAMTLTYDAGRELGLVRPADRYDVRIQTGNGTTHAKRVVLNNVRVGGISLANVEALIAQEGALGVNLLGMTFLSKLRTFEIRNGRLVLEQ